MALRRKHMCLVKFAVAVVAVVFLKTVLQLHSIGLGKLAPQGTGISPAWHNEEPVLMETQHLHGRGDEKEIQVKFERATNKTYKDNQKAYIGSEFEDVNRVVNNLILSVSSCPDLRRPHNVTYAPTGQYWQMNKKGLEEIHVISAFYDDRPPVGIIPYIRILAVSTHQKEAALFCFIWYPGIEQPYVTRVSVLSSGRGERVYGVKYGQWLYSCKLPGSLPVPTHVSISYSECEPSPIYLPIFVPVRSAWQHEFGVCVAIAFGKVDLDLIVEWVEFNKMFGVTEINVYNASMSEEMNKVFDYYREKGLLRLHQMPPPQPDYSKKGSKVSSPASLNDCMLRNAYRYRYMVVIDFDEVIVPKNHLNYTAMMKAIDKENKLAQPWLSYSFRNEYYFFDFKADDTQPKYLRTMRYREHAGPSRYLYAPKSFIDPLQCLSVFNHYCWKRFAGSPKKFTIDVNVDIATSHHYRLCGFGQSKCEEYTEEKTKEDYILKYAPALDRSVSTVLQNLGLLKESPINEKLVNNNTNNTKQRAKRETESKTVDRQKPAAAGPKNAMENDSVNKSKNSNTAVSKGGNVKYHKEGKGELELNKGKNKRATVKPVAVKNIINKKGNPPKVDVQKDLKNSTQIKEDKKPGQKADKKPGVKSGNKSQKGKSYKIPPKKEKRR